MTQRDGCKYVADMLRHIADADEIIAGGEAAFMAPGSTIRFRAAKSIIIDLSSAADRVSDEFKRARPDVPWSPIHKMRSRLAHHYDGISRTLVWETITNDLPKVREALLTAVGMLDGETCDPPAGEVRSGHGSAPGTTD